MMNNYLTYCKNMKVIRLSLYKDNQGALILRNKSLLIKVLYEIIGTGN